MLMVLLVAVCQSPGAGSPGSRLFPQASDAGRVGEKGQGRGMARRVRGWPEVTQQWDKRAQYDVWAEDEVAVGPEQRTSQPSTFGRQGLSVLVSLSTCVPPSLPSLTSFLSCLSSPLNPLIFPFRWAWLSQGVCGVSPAWPGTHPLFSCTLGSPGQGGGSRVRGYGFKSRLCHGTWACRLPALSLSSLF